MNILIYRFYRTDRCVDSEVFLDGEPFCQASESTKGLVPEGEYRVCLQHCRQYQREVPAVEIRPMGARKWLDRCRYCMIPAIRGPLRSRGIADLVQEARL